jgi:TolB-like protein
MVWFAPLAEGGGMAEFFAELKRRHIYRVGAAYVVVAWAVAQVVDLLSQVFALPSWIAQPAIIVIAVGFPIALLVTWVVESKPQQVIASAVRSKPTTLDWMLFGSVAVLIALSGYRLIVPSSNTEPRQAGAISIAVLPFQNLSGDAEQEFFSDGITEEITSALARVPDLRVVARTSAYQFRDQNRDIQSIGQQLHATHFIEGSVRKAGDRVRITAQLIQTDNGLHLWTESYDRDLIDIFAIQEDIAASIAGALRTPLGLAPGERLVSNRTNSPQSYEQYLRAQALVNTRGVGVSQAIAILETVVARDPSFAPAWALLAQAYRLAPNFSPALRTGSLEDARGIVLSSLAKSERAAREAIRLDSRSAAAFAALATVQVFRTKWGEAEDLYKQALVLDPNEPEVLQAYSQTLATIGRLRDALSLREKLRLLEPFVPAYNAQTAIIMQLNGQSEATVPILEAIPADYGGAYSRNLSLARAYAAQGRYSLAADTLLAISDQDQVDRQSLEDAAKLLRTAPTQAKTPAALPALDSELHFVYVYVGALDRVMEYQERNLEIQYTIDRDLWLPEFAQVRKTQRFKSFVRKIGLVDFWRARGWPDLCRPMGTDDFVCD